MNNSHSLNHRPLIGVFFDDPKEFDYPFSIELYRIVYRQLAEDVAKKGGCLAIVRSQETYLGKKTFSHAWVDTDGTFVLKKGPLEVDVIWNKGHLKVDPGENIINDPALDQLCTDKWKAYKTFPDVHPRTLLLKSEKDIATAKVEFAECMVVAKPLDAEGGAGVLIGEASSVLPKILSFPYLLQEFVDTSGGIPGLVEGMHDFRIICIEGEIAICYLRTPPPGEFTANVSRGGREIEVLKNRIPPAALKIFQKVDKHMRIFPHRLYTVDMGLDKDGQWKVFELNSKPGFSPKETGESYVQFFNILSDFLINACQI